MKNIAVMVLMLSIFGCSGKTPPETVQYVDLQRYQGKWYEIAAFPQRFQRGCSCTSAEYEIRGNHVKVVNRCFKAQQNRWTSITGKAFVIDKKSNARLKVQFFWPFRGDYWIIGLADDYSWAAVGDPSRNYLWILARQPSMEVPLYSDILKKLAAQGFDTARLVKTVHNCQ